MSLDNSDNYIFLDGDSVDPALEATVLPKFGMHLYRSSLNETHVYWRALSIVPTVPLFHVFYKLCKQRNWFSFQSMIRKNSDPFLKPSEYNEDDVVRLQEIAISLHKPYNSLLYVAALSFVWKEAGHVPILRGPKGEVLTMAEFLRLSDLHDCKITARALLPPGAALETHLSALATRLKDIPAKTREMEMAEVACRKVLADREKKKRKVEANAVTKVDNYDDVHIERVARKKRASEAGTPRKKIKTRVRTPPVNMDSEHVSSPDPINHSLPVVALVNGEHVIGTALAVRLAALRNQTNEQGSPLDLNNKNVKEPAAGGERGLRIEYVKKPMREKTLLDVKASYSDGRFAILEASMSIGAALSKNYDGALTREKSLQERVEELEEEKKEADQLSVEIINDYLPTFVRRLHQSAEYKWSLGEVFILAICKGFIDGLSVGRKDKDVQTILKATPGVDLTSSSTFKEEYNKLFDKRPTLGQGPRDTPTTSYA
nr:hypothetical protein [Tanacetum cinerariifolium]